MKFLLSLFILLTSLETSYADKYDELVYGDVKYEYPDNHTNINSAINNNKYRLSTNMKITIGFSNGRVFGSSGVNRYMGTYELKAGCITIKGFGSTMMAGPEEDVKAEQEYLKYLDGSHTITIERDKLFIGDKEFHLIKSDKQDK